MMFFRRWSACAMASALALATFALSSPAAAQGGTGTVRGTVTTVAAGAPVAAAQVFVLGTKLGAMTGADGSYTIAGVPLGANTVRVRALGYRPTDQLVSVTAAGVRADFALTAAAVALNQVVVTGTAGAARMREVGNSIGSVKTTENASVPTDVSAMLSGQMAGVAVTGGSGNSGAGSAIRLRGMTSVALTNQPLIYVDGVRLRSDEYPKNVSSKVGQDLRSGNVMGSPMNDINPDDIERIEVVKGAAAATLYGTDAAAGVIQIFTKHGAAGAAKWQAQLTSGFNHEQKFGTDAAPYHRVFNPVTQSKRFDPSGTYLRRYLPELGGLADAELHEPWARRGGPPLGYPPPIVDHAEERVEALRRYEEVKGRGGRR